ncbi:23349_t:CDS:2 [Gigaspora margarita]|uniref:23349_t:CDS:1 n=1 Tax=Gigaspora margarita TaxID=4874 RepID=A0ABN7VUA2_GIGMA|nr:23349_t:CDS:2 [Gigaspora margarita]
MEFINSITEVGVELSNSKEFMDWTNIEHGEGISLPQYIEGAVEIGKILNHTVIAVLTGNIAALVDDIVSYALAAKHCKAECKRLSEQFKIARDSAKELLEQLEESPKEIENKNFSSALKAFAIVLEDGRSVVKQHAEAKYGLKIFFAKKFAAEFQDIEDRLDQACNRLNFAINIRHFVDSQYAEEIQKAWHEEDKIAFAELNTMVKESLKEIRNYKLLTTPPIELGTRIALKEFSDIQQFKTDRLFTANYNITDSDGQTKLIKVVIKVTMARETVADDLTKFSLEVAYLRKLVSCPNIINLIGVTNVRGNLSLALEYCENGDLRTFIASGKLKGDWGKKRGIALGLAQGLAFLHKAGILHKYLNSANVLLDGHFQAKIANFRRSRWTNTGSLGVVDSFEEQIRWTAPERLGDDVSIFTEECDVYSFGIVFYEIICGELPWEGLNLSDVYKIRNEGKELLLPSHIPPAMSTIYTNSTNKIPSQRFKTGEIIHHLEAIRPEDLEGAIQFNGGNREIVNDIITEEKNNFLKPTSVRYLSISDVSDEEDIGNSPKEILDIAEKNHQLRDFVKARSEYERIKDDFPHALFRLGEYYYFAKGVKENIPLAIKYFEQAIKGGDGDAMDMMGYLYLTGKGQQKDRVKAVKFFTQAVEKGVPHGMYHLGVCYFKGLGGLKIDLEESKKLMVKAASLGNEEARNFAHQQQWI